jgi:hypothetical protein
MGQIKGDKARYNRERRKKIARRVETRARRAILSAEGAAPAPPKTVTKSK